VSFSREDLEAVILGSGERNLRRFTQDSPVLPEVWHAFAERGRGGVDLLLAAHERSSPREVAQNLRRRLEERGDLDWARIAYTESYVAVTVTLEELVHDILPLSGWWATYLAEGDAIGDPDERWRARALSRTGYSVTDVTRDDRREGHRMWLMQLVGAIVYQRKHPRRRKVPRLDRLVEEGEPLVIEALGNAVPERPLLWGVGRNRPAFAALWHSRPATKADAATRLFGLDCRELRWAVIDGGIDATHDAFRRRGDDGCLLGLDGDHPAARTRVVATYDFSRLRELMQRGFGARRGSAPAGEPAAAPDEPTATELRELRRNLADDRPVEWSLLEPLLRVDHDERYVQPQGDHGTRVAGILAGDWKRSDDSSQEGDLVGMCPNLELYDFRVLDENGEGEEFTVLAALQFVRYLNRRRDRPTVHGANLSLSLRHAVKSHACGRTPVCQEAERLVASGVVVVAAAGNEGHYEYRGPQGTWDAYRPISITDPGNAEAVITVGATHRMQPHAYGVSYFSSRGPTGDGRAKPDLVAPGEKISAPSLRGSALSFDGTSAAAPHVSGAAALLLSRHRELVGRPGEVKRALCTSATDLGRERSFQGHGMVDVLRAIQAI